MTRRATSSPMPIATVQRESGSRWAGPRPERPERSTGRWRRQVSPGWRWGPPWSSRCRAPRDL